jgi:hypothetical protein
LKEKKEKRKDEARNEKENEKAVTLINQFLNRA